MPGEPSNTKQLTPRGIYIHIPFCSKICSYCDYFVVAGAKGIEDYIRRLKIEIDLWCESERSAVSESEIISIYIGGGTPSLLSVEQLEEIVSHLKSYFSFSSTIEISMESNPASLSKEKLQGIRDIGFNRISIGVQSLIKRELGILTRNHSPMRAEKIIAEAVGAGFDSVNLDIIFAIPDQTDESLRYTLEKALDLGTDHFSAYSLIYEPGTPLYKQWKEGRINRPSEEEDASFYSHVQERLIAAGLNQYEVSNFAREGKECRHNLHAWHAGEYFAFGVSSHGYLLEKRFSNHRDIARWAEDVDKGKLPLATSEVLTKEQILEENIFLPIRADGLSEQRFKRNTGLELPESFKIEFAKWAAKGFGSIHEKDGGERIYKLSPRGYIFCDTITYELLNAATPEWSN